MTAPIVDQSARYVIWHKSMIPEWPVSADADISSFERYGGRQPGQLWERLAELSEKGKP